MSRPVRIEFPGAHYHVTSKGLIIANSEYRAGIELKAQSQSRDREKLIFMDAEDKLGFLSIIEAVVSRYGWLLHSYVLMDSHYYLVIECPQANLSKGMRQLNGVYTQHFNRRHLQDGPLFQGRFKSVLFEPEPYLLPLCRDVLLSPVLEGKSRMPHTYRWSSLRATLGLIKSPPWLHTQTLLHSFRGADNAAAQFREYVKSGIGLPSPLANRYAQVLLGSSRFLNEMQPILNGEKLAKIGPKLVRRRSLNTLFRHVQDKTRIERNDLIRRAHLEHNYTLMEIGEHLGLHYTTVSKVINQAIPVQG
jgi:REP element-mobilizing transposase RayT